MGPLMVAHGWKLLGQVIFIASGIVCLKMHERDVGLMLISGSLGSLVPVAEQHKKRKED
jgi:hypothetical protein